MGKGGRNDEAVLRSCLVWLGAGVVLTGVCTHSWKKMAATYCFWMFAFCGILLPDWKFFHRPISQWCTPLTVAQTPQPLDAHQPPRFKLCPARLLIYAAVYSFGFRKWWNFITTT